ncbi:acetylornithine transaminase [Nocardioides oleivorans]|uniref:Acetylornithine aminotransferase n=1 Tax=Nocardioides oleivorans TaxID=273676 RepID=A0A4Q2RNE4_9ACTN|nr:acetylornithine transaminase [Nocardioides oleivorans]RYB90401.1 acetylornithine transaminase [Nocardioides oleivorans]
MSIQQRYEGAVMNTFGPPALALVRGRGAHVWDADGKEYVDLLGGIAVNALGHAHPALVEAVTTQLQTLGHVSNFFATEPQVALAEKLVALLGWGEEARVFFSNSGAEANEAALKLTRRTGRTRVVAAEGSFHGRTMGALSLTSKAAYRKPFAPLPGDVTFVPYDDVAALEDAVDETVAAVVLEPVQGEAGVVVPSADYLAAAQRIAHAHGALLWLDEVQTGVARTGAWFAHQLLDGVRPDVVTLAKGLGGGIPIGATIARGAAATLLQPGNHGSTFAGNPVASAAALAVLSTIEADGLLEATVERGQQLEALLRKQAGVVEVTGSGLMRGAELDGPYATQAVVAGREAGFILNATGPSRLRFVPPLVITSDDLDALDAALPTILDAARAALASQETTR